MKRRAVLSRAFFRRPAVRLLVPDLKLLLLVLTVGCETHIGVYMPAGVCEDAGLDNTAFEGGMTTLERHGHVRLDRLTGEVFITAFFRDNTFDSPARRRQAVDDFRRIQSAELRDAVLSAVAQSPECGLTAELLLNQHDTSQGKGEGEGEGEDKGKPAARSCRAPAVAAALGRKKGGVLHGVAVWSDQERAEVEALAAAHGADAVRLAAEHVVRDRTDGRAFLSMVRPLLASAAKAEHTHQRDADLAEKRAADDAAALTRMRADPHAMKIGRNFLAQRKEGRSPSPE